MPDPDYTAPVDPFGATVAGVSALVAEAKLVTGAGPLPAGKFGITEAQVLAWVQEITGTVAMSLDGWQSLAKDPVEPETTSDRDQLIEYARTIIHNGAGSYLEAARHPERAALNDTSYSAVLWDRYKYGLESLMAWLTKRLADGEDGPAGGYQGGISFNFPTPLFGDGLRF